MDNQIILVNGPHKKLDYFKTLRNMICHEIFLNHFYVEINDSFKIVMGPCSLLMNSMKLVIPLHLLYWSIHTKDESKHGTVFAFISGVN